MQIPGLRHPARADARPASPAHHTGRFARRAAENFHALPVIFTHTATMSSLTNAKIRELKARGQLLKPALKVGHDGLSPQFIAELDKTLQHHDLVKVKFSDLKDQKKTLAPQLAEKTGSELIMRVGNVAVLYREKPAEEKTAEIETGD
jgi:RNA-binding protein